MRLLLVDDNPKLAEWVAKALRHSGYAIDIAENGSHALQLLRTEDYDLAMLDLFLPDFDGFEVLRRGRRAGSRIPIIVVSARDELETRVMSLELGADDFLGKPFDLEEIEARIKALIRRAKGYGLQQICCGALTYDVTERAFHLDDKPFWLPPKEHAVLELLITRQGRAVRKETIFEKVYSLDSLTGSDAIEVYVHRLRRRLCGSGVRIITLRGLGYCIEEDKSIRAHAGDMAGAADAWHEPLPKTPPVVAAM